jgi:hypothetical protein
MVNERLILFTPLRTAAFFGIAWRHGVAAARFMWIGRES